MTVRCTMSAKWWRGRWRSWWSIIWLLPVAGRVAVAAMVLNLVIGVLPLGFVIGTSVAIGRVTGAGRGIWGGVLPAVGLAVVSLLLQSVLSPFQAAFTELISRRVDGACARRLMQATLTGAPAGLLEQPDVLDKMGDSRRGLVEYSTTPGAAVAGLIALIARYGTDLELPPISSRSAGKPADRPGMVSVAWRSAVGARLRSAAVNDPDRLHSQRRIRDGMIPAGVSTNSARGSETSGTNRK